MKQNKWDKLHKELDEALDSEFDSKEELQLESVFKNAKLALREYLLENKEKVANDLDEMRIKSNHNNMKQTAVEWLGKELESYGDPQFCKIEWEQLDLLIQQAKEMEKEKRGYSYDEIRTIAYNAYCLGQLDEPTEGKYNLWIQQYKK
jgi:hypothetical protein